MQKIMFNDRYGLADAVLEGYKIVTRRAVSDKIIAKAKAYQQEYFATTLDAISLEDAILEFSTYKVGEVVAIAQSYKDAGVEFDLRSDESLVGCAGWNNKMFVEACLMPHRIRITDIRVERLQDISDEDCYKEGIWDEDSYYSVTFGDYKITYPYCRFEEGGNLFTTPRKAFAALIDKVSGKGTWESNPYVWVYSFELIK